MTIPLYSTNPELQAAFMAGKAYSDGIRYASLVGDAKISRTKIKEWITVKGTPIPIGKNGRPASSVGRRIFEETKASREEKGRLDAMRNHGGRVDQRYVDSSGKWTGQFKGKVPPKEFGSASKNDRTLAEPFREHQSRYDEIVDLGKNVIAPDVRGIAKSVGGSLVGEETGIKSGSSLSRKLKKNSFQDINDIVRFTVAAKHDRLAGATKSTVKRLKERGYGISDFTNTYSFSKPKYKGIHVTGRAGGVEKPTDFEVQLHSPRSLDVKNTSHSLYEKQRVLDPKKDKKEIRQLDRQMREMASTIPNPKGIRNLGKKR